MPDKKASKAMISFEALFSFLTLLFVINLLLLTKNAKELDTGLYRYQLLNDCLEVFEKDGNQLLGQPSTMDKIAARDAGGVTIELNKIKDATSYCLFLEVDGSRFASPDNCDWNDLLTASEQVSTKRTIVMPGPLGVFGYATLTATLVRAK